MTREQIQSALETRRMALIIAKLHLEDAQKALDFNHRIVIEHQEAIKRLEARAAAQEEVK
jgi:hypothetical protein